jgi:hypothetical protein
MDDNEEYAKLLSSVNIANTRLQRPLSPIQTATSIERLIDEEGYSIAEALLPIGKKIISDFIKLKNSLPEQCHDAITWGSSDDLGVGFSAAHAIATLDTDDEKLLLFNAASNKVIKFEDLIEIIRFYKDHDLPLEEVIQKVTNARPKVSITYLVVISISEITKKVLEAMGKRSQKTVEVCLNELFEKKLHLNEIEDVQIKGKNIAIALKKNEYNEYKKQILKMNLEYDKISEYLVN